MGGRRKEGGVRVSTAHVCRRRDNAHLGPRQPRPRKVAARARPERISLSLSDGPCIPAAFFSLPSLLRTLTGRLNPAADPVYGLMAPVCSL